MMKLLSIITVSKNAEDTIEQTIISVSKQRTSDVEFIIIDGGSIDRTVDIIKKHQDQVDSWMSQPDKGIYDAMNKGIDLATGRYLLFINADDMLSEGAIQIFRTFSDKFDADVFYGNVCVIHDNKQYYQLPLSLDMFYWLLPFGHQSAFIRKTKDLKYDENYKIAGDYELLLDLYYRGKKFCYIPYTIAYYRSGGASDVNEYRCGIERCDVASKLMVKYAIGNELYKKNILMDYIEVETKDELIKEGHKSLFATFIKERIADRNVIVYGCGEKAGQTIPLLVNNEIKIKNVVDGDSMKVGEKFYNYEIKSPEDSIRSFSPPNDVFFIISGNGEAVIYRLLKQMGVDDSSIIRYGLLWDDYTQKFKQHYIDKSRQKVPGLVKLYS